MKVVLGIGNPGREYADTRHNAGFRVIDGVAGLLGRCAFRKKRKFRALVCEGTFARAGSGGPDAGRVLLMKPETYVNLSGESARVVADYYGVPADSFLAVADDVNLPLGRLRARRGGSSGGHNGLESIARHLGTEDFARLRVGVGRPPGEGRELTGHVLGTWSAGERAEAERAEERAAGAVIEGLEHGIEACMNRYNPEID